MLKQLLLTSATFHTLNLAALIFLARVWRHRYAEEPAIQPRLAQLLTDFGVLGSVAVFSAAAIGTVGDVGGFGIIHLLSQWVFAEFLVFLGLAGWWLRRSGSRTTSWGFAAAVLTFLAIFTNAHFVEPRSLEVNEHRIDLTARRGPQPTFVSRALSSPGERGAELRIVHLSDIQTAVIGKHERRAFREAVDLQPDIILFTGDYLQALAGREDLSRAHDDFRHLLNSLPVPRLGIYAVKGDVEGPEWPSVFESTRVVALTDAFVRIPLPGSSRSMSVLGLSSGLARGRDGRTLRRLVAELPPDDVRVVFGHNPDFIMALDEGTADLALAGHTHGGQIVVPFFGAPLTLSRLPRRMARGLHDWKGTPIHVSAGVGMERGYAPQVRFLCRPEVCLLRVQLKA